MTKRLRAYLRFIDRFGGIALLLAFWAILVVTFIKRVAPRLSYFTGRPIAVDPPCQAPQCDFAVFWSAGRLARQGSFDLLYDHQRFNIAAQALLGVHGYIEHFLYPPPFLPVLGTLSFLPFECAALVWAVGFWALAAWMLRRAGYSWLVILITLLSPAALFSLQIGQVGIIGDALLVSGLTLAATAPARGGALLGILAVKPQVGILVPFALLAQKRWRALVAFAVVVVALSLLSLAWFGTGPWYSFLAQDPREARSMIAPAFDPHSFPGLGVSLFWMARSFGAGFGLAQAMQALLAVACVLALFLWRRRLDFVGRVVLLSLLASPYDFVYGMVGYSLILAQSAQNRHWRIGILDALLFLWPGLCLVISIATGHELTPLIVLAALWRTALPRPAPVLPAPAQE
ncbi:glycosyltransferase family 87 protein [Acidocella sp. MX-AZ02]|uniref:glycosyltransferase family 87 protein n=1 Tax=Acidocella sp. MX-AZ02 TaxID=1214225 RepID=UPI00028EAC23|nr:glycosyltransferase family 87 protein [Acidocella sp. MX-AZ02]EKN00500.1 hypothetical protein MXAZACID_05061 [Acidocella sp. MX-AZ02]